MGRFLQVGGVFTVSQTVETVWGKTEVFIQNVIELASWAGGKN